MPTAAARDNGRSISFALNTGMLLLIRSGLFVRNFTAEGRKRFRCQRVGGEAIFGLIEPFVPDRVGISTERVVCAA
jgi:hypothetical protein